MKLRNIIRLKALVIGTAVTLFFITTVQAQEIENTAWNDGSDVAAFLQSAPEQATQPAASPATDSVAMSPSTATTTAVATRESAVTQWAAVEIWILCSLLVCIAIVAVYALLETRRINRIFNAQMKSMNLRTTHS
jgi:amino acid transporter